MLSKEEIETCKEEARNYIEFMETAGDNAGWTRGLIWYINQLESREQKLIEKLEKDIVNITKTMQDGKHCDDYSRCRLKAYRTKTKEILAIVKGEKK